MIITALKLECQAVCAYLANIREETHQGTVYECGEFEADTGVVRVAVAEVGMGNARAAAETQKAISRYAPQVVLFVGVAGGIKDVAIGDVVAASKVYAYESGKVAEQTQPRPEMFRPTQAMEQRARAVARHEAWLRRISRTGQLPNARVDAVAAGEKVISSTASPEFAFIRMHYGDAVAVDMEGIGFLCAARSSSTDALVIRGISDLIDDKDKADASGSQEVAARNASAFAFEVLATWDWQGSRRDAKSRRRDTVAEGTNSSYASPQGPLVSRQPSVWSVPFRQNPNFTGRDELLSALEGALASGGRAVLSGLGGVGKTQLALEYIYRHSAGAREYDVVWWLLAEDAATLALDYGQLATALGLPQREAKEKALARQAVRRWLDEHERWLLVFDNAPNLAAAADYLPQRNTGRVIITSRDPNWAAAATVLPVGAMGRDDAVDFLCKRAPVQDKEAARDLAEALGDLPLALEQAAAYIEATGSSMSRYVQLLRSHPAKILSYGKPVDYPATVATTWDISFARLEEESPPGAALLRLCAFLAPEPVPLKVLAQGAALLPKSLSAALADELRLDEVLGALHRYSMAGINENGLTVHRLVQAVMRDRMPATQQGTWAEAALHLINNAFDFRDDDIRTWTDCRDLLPHALAVTGHAEQLTVVLEPLGDLLNAAARYLRNSAVLSEARVILERALKIDEAAYGADHPSVARDVNNLGSVLKDLGDLTGARQCFERAIKIAEAACGADHPSVGTMVSNLGAVLKELGDLAGARQCLERALKIDEVAYGTDHPSVTTDVNNLGSVLNDLGDLAGAQQCFERALKIVERTARTIPRCAPHSPASSPS